MLVNARMIHFAIVLTAVAVFFSCQIVQPSKQEAITDAFDGTYNISYISEGVLTAIANIDIDKGKINGAIVNTRNETFHVHGTVDASGSLDFSSLTSSADMPVTANGVIATDGTVEGEYTVGSRQGKYFGFRYADLETGSVLYDGRYQLTFRMGDIQTAVSEITIMQGAFNTTIQTITTESFPVSGRVLEDGRLLMTTTIGDYSTGIAATGAIDAQRHVTGIFYTQEGEKGDFIGQQIEAGF